MTKSKNRDEFTSATKQKLAKRTGYLCSNPQCNSWTCGPDLSRDSNVIFYGTAAHITAAARGGPRYDESLSAEQRRSIHNGIYLCEFCASKIDEEWDRYPVDLLRKWKQLAEENAYKRLDGNFKSSSQSPLIISSPIRLGKHTGVDVNGQKVTCISVPDNFAPPWFFDDLSFVNRFLVQKSRVHENSCVVLCGIEIHVDFFEKPTNVKLPLFPMGAKCVPHLYRAVIGNPAVENTKKFPAIEIGEYLEYPTPILLDNDPMVIDIRVDANTVGLFQFSIVFKIASDDSSIEMCAADKIMVYFF